MCELEDNAWVDIHLARWPHFRGEGLIPRHRDLLPENHRRHVPSRWHAEANPRHEAKLVERRDRVSIGVSAAACVTYLPGRFLSSDTRALTKAIKSSCSSCNCVLVTPKCGGYKMSSSAQSE